MVLLASNIVGQHASAAMTNLWVTIRYIKTARMQLARLLFKFDLCKQLSPCNP